MLAGQTIAALGLWEHKDGPVLRALVRGYGGFVQELTIEWLHRGRLDERQVREAMVATLPLLIEQVMPRVREVRAARRGTRARGR